MTTITQVGSNKPSFDSIKQEMRSLGEQEGQGNDCQIKAHLRAVEMAHLGVLDNTKDKHGPGKDDATVLAAEYWAGRNGKQGAQWDPRARNNVKLRSTFNLDIRLGNWSAAGGPTEPWATTTALMNEWRKRKAIPAEAKQLQDATACLHRFAAAQTKAGRKTLIDPAEFDQFLKQKSKDPQTAEDYVLRIRNTARRLTEGKLPGGVKADDPMIKSIVQSATSWLAEHARQRGGKGATGTHVPAPKKAVAPAVGKVTSSIVSAPTTFTVR